MNEEVNKQAEPEKTVEKYNQYVDAAGYSHFVTRDENGQMLADKSFDKDGNTQSASYYKNGVLDSKTIYNEDGSRHSFFYEDDGSVRSEKLVSADGRSVSSIAHTGGMTTTELLDEQGRTAYTVSYYNDGGKLYPWNEHSYAYDADGKQIDDQVRSFGTDGEKGGKTSEELLASLQYKDEWLMQTFADRVSDRVTAEEAQKTAGVVNTVEEKQAEPVQEERKAKPVEEVKQAEPVQEERKAEPVEEVKQAEQVAESDAYVNTITSGSEEREEKQAEQAAESDAYVNTITSGSEEREEKQVERAAESDAYVNTITSGSEEREEKQPDQVFDKDGRLSEQTLYDNLGRVSGSVAYAYSDDGSVSMYTYDVDGQQTGFDSYDAEGHRKFAADFSNGVQQNFVRFDDEGRPTNIELYNEGQPAVLTSIQYDGDAVYKDVRSADGQLLRSETTRNGRMSIVDYVDQKARAFSFDRGGDVYDFTDYAIQDGKAVKVKDGQFNLSGQEREARFYDADGRVTEGLIRDSEESVTNYSFNEDGSYKESGPNGDKTHRAIRLFGKNVYTPQMPEFSENWSNEIPVAVDGDNHPQLSEQELACFRQGYVEIGKGGSNAGYYSERLPCMNEEVFRTKLFTQAADRLAQVGGVKREASNSGAEQSFANTQQNGGAEQTAADNRANDAGERDTEQQTQPVGNGRAVPESENAVNENREEQVCSVENADEQETNRGLDEPNCFQQGQNLKQWLNYFSMEGSRAKPPYASPFEKVTGCHNDKEYNAAVLDLENGNRIVNSPKRLDLLIRRTGPEKVEPTLAECMTLVRLGQQKGWTSARITGSKEFQKQMYLACRALGMPTKDFIPTEEMLKEGAELESVYNNKSKIMPQSKEDAAAQKPQVREPTLAERCYDLDDRFRSLEKIRKAQPERPKTAEDPDPELANFDTIRTAEQKGICPVTGIAVPREDDGNEETPSHHSTKQSRRSGQQIDEKPLSDNIVRAHAQVVQALKGLNKAEKNQKEALLTSARQKQRDEWRARLQEVAQKESAGEQLTKDELHVKAMADKYQIKNNPAEEPENPRPIDRADFSKTTEKNLRKQEKSAEIRTIFTASVVLKENAANIGAMLNGKKNAKPLSAEELITRGNAQLKQETVSKPPVSELIKKVGENNAFTKTQAAENAQKYRDLTGHEIPRRRMNQLEERVVAIKKSNSR